MKIATLIIPALLLMQSIYAQDWANLKRYQEANEMVNKQMTEENRVVFMGNSITEGWLQQRPEFFQNKPYINRGISGQTTPQMLIRFKQDVVHLNPEVVVILAGINDIAGNTGPSTLEMIFDNISSMAEIAVNHDIKVVLCSTLPAYDFPWRPGMEPAEKVVKLNAMLKAYGQVHGHTYVDYFSAMADDKNGLQENLGYDGVHPNGDGYAIMEPLVEEGIKKAQQN